MTGCTGIALSNLILINQKEAKTVWIEVTLVVNKAINRSNTPALTKII